jgi:hypothetical protein
VDVALFDVLHRLQEFWLELFPWNVIELFLFGMAIFKLQQVVLSSVEVGFQQHFRESRKCKVTSSCQGQEGEEIEDGQETFVHDALKSNAAGIHVQITKDIEREKREKEVVAVVRKVR